VTTDHSLAVLPSLAARSDVTDCLSLAANDCTNVLTGHHDPEHHNRVMSSHTMYHLTTTRNYYT